MAVLGEASSRGLRFGEDIIYTGGPLSFLYTSYFQSDKFVLNLALNLLLITAVALLVTILAWKNRRIWSALLFPAVAMTMFYPRDALFLSAPFLTAMVAVSGVNSAFAMAAIGVGILAAASASLAKFSVALLAASMFSIVDLVRLYHRRVPFCVVSYLLAMFALFTLLEGSVRFVPFVTASFSVASGYAAAMSTSGSFYEIGAFLLAALFIMGIAVLTEYNSIIAGVTKWPTSTGRILIIALFLFMLWKLGFVRQPGHTFISWSGLAIVAATYLIAVSAVTLGRARAVALSLMSILAIFVMFPWVWSYAAHLSPWYMIRYQQLSNVGRQIAAGRGFIADSTGWLAHQRQAKIEAWARIRKEQPLPRLDGSVDVIPSIQSSVLAHGLDYRPRFSIQEFTTYTKLLIEANRRFLVEHGPDYLLFQPGSIDDRYPAMAEGPLWPEIIRYYFPVETFGELAVLRRRKHPLPGEILGPPVARTVGLNETLELTESVDPQFLTAQIRLTLLGKIVGLIWRPPLALLHVTFADGRQHSYRVIPAIAEVGFFVSPLIATADAFVMIEKGHSEDLPILSRVSFQTSWAGSFMYEKKINLTLRQLSLRALGLSSNGG